MATHDRLRRYMEEDLGSCQDDEFEQRVEQLEALDAAVGDSIETDVEILSALANETRYKIVRLLEAAEGELCVCEFAPLLDVSDGAISHALSKLTDAGLVTRRKEGKWRKYRTTRRATALLVALDGARESDR
ncbi:ArsR/SmtB family transcription factor [Halapricum hydrolyticum]|uniref:Metalloregulator ArsR/SmtB family transcription factor n=1 Tax=Halapricum hydrolyticum TaxID=2979991 RepID=A0AAE3LFI1_9EURY|nr:metalloregulator ArsR/SmtB family transcription factor [Halapricum hydrolyticum]MCU4718806.1 metalloregulator ArsR/SmtB family transcription factor [Halapricum hydrolyticum]MCU4727786.1 metalloregulator ArsR/SmtB family transcription factor [Halapricum hydrolyticum]